MDIEARGKSTVVEISNISTQGIWLLTHNKELFMSYDDFPWFKNQTVKAIINVEEASSGHYYWPDIDIDLSDEIIEHPAHFPLNANENKVCK